tara:strand:- start:3283 stop:3399 length:117 start_codon:yes stop_codon:yes gene_type:complete
LGSSLRIDGDEEDVDAGEEDDDVDIVEEIEWEFIGEKC